jgi:hypothetical protein
MANPTITFDQTKEIGPGTIVIAPDTALRSSSIIINNEGISLSSSNPAIGIHIDSGGVTIQGQNALTSYGTRITKGPYSENDKSAKPYTYIETVQVEGAALEQAYTRLGEQGMSIPALNQLSNEGRMPIVTDVGPGMAPHVHTITMFKHIHKIEPTYLYRIPSVLTTLKQTIQDFTNFLK